MTCGHCHQPGGRKEARPPAQAGWWVLEEGLSVHHKEMGEEGSCDVTHRGVSLGESSRIPPKVRKLKLAIVGS